jgi:hypothetical protein
MCGSEIDIRRWLAMLDIIGSDDLGEGWLENYANFN